MIPGSVTRLYEMYHTTQTLIYINVCPRSFFSSRRWSTFSLHRVISHHSSPRRLLLAYHALVDDTTRSLLRHCFCFSNEEEDSCQDESKCVVLVLVVDRTRNKQQARPITTSTGRFAFFLGNFKLQWWRHPHWLIACLLAKHFNFRVMCPNYSSTLGRQRRHGNGCCLTRFEESRYSLRCLGRHSQHCKTVVVWMTISRRSSVVVV